MTKQELRELLKHEFGDQAEYSFQSGFKNMYLVDTVGKQEGFTRGYRCGEIQDITNIIIRHYLGFPEQFGGYPDGLDIATCLTRGVDMWVEYFCGDWWKSEEDEEYFMDKSHPEWEPKWYRPFSEGIILGLLSERWDDIARVCDWVEWGLDLGYMGDDSSDYDIGFIYLSIASKLRETPMPGVEQLDEYSAKFKRRSKALYNLWKTVLDEDQAAFDKEFVKAVKQDASRKKRDGSYLGVIAEPHSVIAMTARRLGMTLPELEPKLDAFVLLPEKLGLPSEYAA